MIVTPRLEAIASLVYIHYSTIFLRVKVSRVDSVGVATGF